MFVKPFVKLMAYLVQPGYSKVKGCPSRGALTVDFLRGQQSPLEYLQGLDAQVQHPSIQGHYVKLGRLNSA